jgi:hypothetical protein
MGLPTQGDEKRLGPATTFNRTVALSFVIPSEAEGSAVSLHPKPIYPNPKWSSPVPTPVRSIL